MTLANSMYQENKEEKYWSKLWIASVQQFRDLKNIQKKWQKKIYYRRQ